PWLDGCHGLPSVRPADGAIEHFYYPGFTERSGGLLREHGLLERRDAFVGSAAQHRWLQALGIARRPGARLVTLFCYPDAPLTDWFAALADGPRPHHVLVPESVADGPLAAFFGGLPAPRGTLQHGRLTVQRIPFLAHDDYDRLLWSADLNFVRGEDSWIRAHWAARPFVWQPYVQAEGTHLVKLRAFLARLSAGPAADAMLLAWSGAGALAPAWRAFDEQLDALAPAWRHWCAKLGAQRDLATRLVEFCTQRL
ncbi:MAG: elongation factor P maturation arginine rhamnosyltransferase EarP, partial [Burkholderiaceae bacterium]|nr:elongation factor P maturation arginine rhamnosyltransferase EarP [Burkholderiaceae bacterium]